MYEHIFRANDIRGIAHSELTTELVRAIGCAFGHRIQREYGASRIFVGKDARLHSEALARAFMDGLATTPCQITYGGYCSSPVSYFAASQPGGQYTATVMVTGSHNPPEYNGFKMTLGGRGLNQQELLDLRDAVAQHPAALNPSNPSSVTQRSLNQTYMDYLCSLFDRFTGLRVGLDCANTTMGLLAPAVFRRLGAEVHELFSDIDGTFPNHHPDPTQPENMQPLIELVQSHQLDVGFGYDGDGDRIGVVLPHPDGGVRILWSDQLLLLFAGDMSRRNPGRPVTVVSEVKCSQVMYDGISRLPGFQAIMWKAGHSFIKEKMRESGAWLGGEMSGHIFFHDEYLGFDDALYASCRFARILLERPDIWAELQPFAQVHSTPELRIECPDDQKFVLVEQLAAYLADQSTRTRYGIRDILDMDGLRIIFTDATWALLRPSNTQPALVMRIEAPAADTLENVRQLLESFIQRFQPNSEV